MFCVFVYLERTRRVNASWPEKLVSYVSWLVGRSVGRSVGQLVGWLVGWLVRSFVS